MANNRIYYAIQQAVIEGITDNTDFDWVFDNSDTAIHGLQSVSMDANYNLNQVFELGQQAIYENIEDLPDVNITLTKTLDGYPLIYHLATVDAASYPTLAGRQNAKCKFALGIWPDDEESASSGINPPSVCASSGLYVGSIKYNFPLEDNFTEEVTLVGNHRIWKNGDVHIAGGATAPDPSLPWATIDMAGQFDDNDDEPIGLGGVNRRQDLAFADIAALGVDYTILPPEVYGISSSGTNDLVDDVYNCHLSSISVSVDLGREQINELDRRGPYHRFATFPVEVTTEIEITASSGDMASHTEEGIYGTGTGICEEKSNLLNRTIRIATCEGTRIYLGTKNKLASVRYGGGDAGGGNVAVTYTFTTFNDFTVLHSGDPHVTGATWWAARTGWLSG